MINIGNKEITSIYCGKNAVNGIYCGQTLIWPTSTPTKKHYLVSFYSDYPDASYDMENPDGGTPDHEFFQEVYESTSDDKIYIAKVVQEYDTDSYEILNWWYSADSRYIADDEIQVFVPVIAYGEMEDVGECWFRSEMLRTFDNQDDADEYVYYIRQNGIDDFTEFEMSAAKNIVYDDTEPYTEFPYTRSVCPPRYPIVDIQNWITEVYDELPKYNEHELKVNQWITGTIKDSQPGSEIQTFDSIWEGQRKLDNLEFKLTSLNGMEIEETSDMFFKIWWSEADGRWNCYSKQYDQSISTKQKNIDGTTFKFNLAAGGSVYRVINFDLTRTSIDPTI